MTSNPKDEQVARFIEAARAAGADEDEAAFKAKLAKIANQTPKKPDENSSPKDWGKS